MYMFLCPVHPCLFDFSLLTEQTDFKIGRGLLGIKQVQICLKYGIQHGCYSAIFNFNVISRTNIKVCVERQGR